MKTFATFFLFLVIFFSVNENIFAQNTYKYGNVIYRIPAGYTQQQGDSTILLTPAGQDADDAEIAFAITEGIGSVPNNLNQVMQVLVNKVEAGRQVVKRETQVQSEDGYQVLSQISVTKVGRQIYFSIYVLANPGGRGELLVVSTSNPAAIEKYQREIAQFFDGIQFANVLDGSAVAQNNRNSNARSSNNTQTRRNNSTNQQSQRNRNNTNQIFLNSITNNYNNLSRSF